MRRSAFTALVAAFAAARAARAAEADDAVLTVFAAASLRAAFSDIAQQFESDNRVSLRFNFAGANVLATQILQGAPADVFASANQEWMANVAAGGKLAAPAAVFARNRLVMIVPRTNPAKIASAADLGKPGVKLVLEAPMVPAGKYARDAFKAMSADPAYGADFAARVEASVASNEMEIDAVASKVVLGEADAGVVFVTELTPVVRAKVTTVDLPAAYAPLASYPIAALKNAAAPQLADKFVAFVLSPQGQAVLRRHGFLAPAEPDGRASPPAR
jgi:molybdate transport system substrate-binding protein